MSRAVAVFGDELLTRAKETRLTPGLRGLLASRRFLPICPEDRLYLEALGHGDDARFAGLFRKVWRQIPEPVRERMLAFWKGHERIPGVLGVAIALEFCESARTGGMAGVCEPLGNALTFFAPVVDRMPPQHVEALIAHALAHVLQASDRSLPGGWRSEWLDGRMLVGVDDGTVEAMMNALLRASDSVEYEADRIARRWGFDTLALNRWLYKNLRREDLPERDREA